LNSYRKFKDKLKSTEIEIQSIVNQYDFLKKEIKKNNFRIVSTRQPKDPNEVKANEKQSKNAKQSGAEEVVNTIRFNTDSFAPYLFSHYEYGIVIDWMKEHFKGKGKNEQLDFINFCKNIEDIWR
jgi:hypothetical protein